MGVSRRLDDSKQQRPGQGWAQIVAFLGTYELFINKPVGDEPGNFGDLSLLRESEAYLRHTWELGCAEQIIEVD